MDRRFVEAQGQKIVDAIESGIGKRLDEKSREELLTGPDEINLVRSGLEDTMRESYGEIKEQYLSNDKITDRRMAAYALAITKIASIYESMHL
jgi:glutamate dehydrogenase (NAD(P)+)